jgi:hypothetical protein
MFLIVLIVVCVCVFVCADLELCILHSDLGQPSQSDQGKNVKASTNGPICRRGQCRGSTMGIGTRWTTSHQHQQYASSACMFTFDNMNSGIIMWIYSKICVSSTPLTPFYFSLQVTKNWNYVFIVENSAIVNTPPPRI